MKVRAVTMVARNIHECVDGAECVDEVGMCHPSAVIVLGSSLRQRRAWTRATMPIRGFIGTCHRPIILVPNSMFAQAIMRGAAVCADKIKCMHLVDLSHAIEHEMTTYPGLPGPQIGEHLSFEASAARYAPGTEFSIGQVTMVGNTGTYLDTPAHRFRDGYDLSGLALERCALLPAVVFDANGAIGPELFGDVELAGTAVLLRTGWDQHWRSPRYGDPDHPYLTEAGAQALVDRSATLVGIDSVNIDDTRTGHRPAHTVLLGAGVPVVEHLANLDGLPRDGAYFSAVPPAVRGLATFPVRAFAFTA